MNAHNFNLHLKAERFVQLDLENEYYLLTASQIKMYKIKSEQLFDQMWPTEPKTHHGEIDR